MDDPPLQRWGCANPARGRIALSAQVRKDEWISAASTGGSTLDVEPYVLKTSSYSYSFPTGTTLGPGQAIRVHTGATPPRHRHGEALGHDGSALNNGGGVARLQTYNDIEIACMAYGSKSR